MVESKKRYEKFLSEFKGAAQEIESDGFDWESAAMDIAMQADIIYKEYLEAMGVSDVIGRLADDIYAAGLK